MCKAVEEYAAAKAIEGRLEGKIEGKIETIRNLLKENIPLEIALKCAELSKADFDKYSANTRESQ